jgi:hypothetical protein
LTIFRSANSSSQSRFTDSSSESDVIDKHDTKSNKHHTNLMPLAVLPSAIARSTNTIQLMPFRHLLRGGGAFFVPASRCARQRWRRIGSRIFGDDVGLLRIEELPTAQAFVNANDLIFADIGMGQGSKA